MKNPLPDLTITNYIGIDPGLKGGVAILKNFEDGNPSFFFHNMPVTNESGENIINSPELNNLLKEYKYDITCRSLCVIEKSQAMPGQGVVSCFNYGRTYGSIYTVLSLLNIPIVQIRPVQWKKHFDLLKKDKQASVDKASSLYPEYEPEFYRENKRKAGEKILLDGKAEAFLIALYGYSIKNLIFKKV